MKICGITRPEDGALAAALGADAVGLVFHPKSTRVVGVERARAIVAALPPFVTRVGLFVNAADLAMTLLFMAARRAGEGERHLRGHAWTGWRPTHMIATKVSGKTLGLVGFGRIARAVAARAHHGFGMKILYQDPYPPPKEVADAVAARQCPTVEELLEQSDFVSMHCPGGKETRHLMNAERLKRMKPSAILINSARGDIVDEQALVSALKSGTITAAGLDVYENEPRVTEELLGMENVVLLPHLGSATRETRVAMGMRVLENVEAFFAGRPPPDRVA